MLRGLAVDWWCLLKNEWIDTGRFGLTATLQGMAASEVGPQVA